MAQVTTARGQIGEKDRTVFWRHLSGELMIAPDTRMTPFRNWTRIECHTVKETEFYSRQLARQEFDKFKSMKITDHLRYKEKREQIKANCLLRLAKGCISAADEQATRMTLKNVELKDELLYKLIATEPDLSRASLEIEKYDSQTIKARGQGKRAGLADHEINIAAKLAEGVR